MLINSFCSCICVSLWIILTCFLFCFSLIFIPITKIQMFPYFLFLIMSCKDMVLTILKKCPMP